MNRGKGRKSAHAGKERQPRQGQGNGGKDPDGFPFRRQALGERRFHGADRPGEDGRLDRLHRDDAGAADFRKTGNAFRRPGNEPAVRFGDENLVVADEGGEEATGAGGLDAVQRDGAFSGAGGADE